MNNIKILVVDDEMDFASSLAERLELRNFTCKVCYCGKEALQVIDQKSSEVPDVVVLDLKMPDMSGLEVLAEIKKRHPDIQVIMLTGHGSISSGMQGKEGGAFDYLIKPFDINELEHKIKVAVKSKSPVSKKLRGEK